MRPGWYEDRDDPALARWFDGEAMTEHTLVVAEQPRGQVPPPPTDPLRWVPEPPSFSPEPAEDGQAAATVFEQERGAVWSPWPDDREEAWSPWPDDRDEAWSPWPEHAPVSAPKHRFRQLDPDLAFERRGASLRDRLAALPWRTYALPIGGVALLLVAVIGVVLTRDDRTQGLETSQGADLDEAAALALDASDATTFDSQAFESLLPIACDAAATGATDRLVTAVTALDHDDARMVSLLEGLRVGARALCPDATTGHPGLFDDVLAEVVARRAPDVPPNAALTVDTSTTTVAEATSTSTTKAPAKATSTTKASPTTTATTAPPTTAAPTTTATTSPPTTAPVVERNEACSTPGATARMSDGTELTCERADCVVATSSFVWRDPC